MAVFDIIACACGCYMFGSRLHAMQESHKDYCENMWKKARRYYLIMILNTVTTVGFLAIIIISNIGFFSVFDLLFSVVILMLLSPYYPQKSTLFSIPQLIDMKAPTKEC